MTQSNARIDTPHRRRELSLYFGGTYAITWGLAALLLLAPELMACLFGPFSTESPIYYLAVYAPGITALILTGTREGTVGIVRLLATLRPRWSSAPYYAAVLLGWPLLDTVALTAQAAITGGTTASIDYVHWYLAPGFLLMRLALDAGPLGEELGWRGYALPRLLGGNFSALTAALVLGVIWGMWHVPAFVISGTAQHDQGMGIVWLILGTTLVSVMMTWLYQRTGGDVLASGVLVHLMNNVTLASLPYLDVVYAPVALVAAVALRRNDRSRAIPSANE